MHAEAVADGESPTNPYEFALAVAARLDMDVELTVRGASHLDDAGASYLPDDQLILVADDGSRFDRAFRAAHEIGHAVRGDGRSRPDDSGPARAPRAAASDEEGVSDYARRQRLEVQLDLFARELLLPRSLVRALYVNDGLCASEIASRFGAPFEVVAQQLFDALLLPTDGGDSGEAPSAKPLDPDAEQRAAATHTGRRYLLLAGPGTGKTQTLTSRVSWLLEQGADPKRMLLLTFSNRAATEMSGRIAARHPEAAGLLWAGTFNAFGFDLLRRFHGALELRSDVRVLERSEAIELLEKEILGLDLKHYRNLANPVRELVEILDTISRAKDELVDAAHYAEEAHAMLERATTEEERVVAERAAEVARVYDLYEQLKREGGQIDLADQIMLPARLLESSAEVRAHLRDQYDHVLVDEYQDVNRASVRLLSALVGENAHLWAVGDGRQSIYRFRGASPFNVERFGAEDFPEGCTGQLTTSYRAAPEIVATCNAFAGGMSGVRLGTEDLRSRREAVGHTPMLRVTRTMFELNAALVEAIEEMRGAGYAYRDQAILCAGNPTLCSVAADLARDGVPTLFLGSVFERREVREALALLSMVTDRRGAGLLRVGGLPDFSMSLQDASAVIDRVRANGDVDTWRDHPPDCTALSTTGRSALENLIETLAGFDHGAAPWRTLAELLLDRTRVVSRLIDRDDHDGVLERMAIWQLMNFVRDQRLQPGVPIERLLERIRQLMRANEDRALRQLPGLSGNIDAVQIMTAHGAKGLEASVVHVIGLNTGSFPRTPPESRSPLPPRLSEDDADHTVEDEQDRLFYVALSRARERLVLYACEQDAYGRSRPPSPYLSRLPDLVTLPKRAYPHDERTPRSGTARVSFSADSSSLSVSDLAFYDRCPRRFLYTRVLQIGRRRRSTPLMLLHEAVQRTLDNAIGELGDKSLHQRIEYDLSDSFRELGLDELDGAGDYRACAERLLAFYRSRREGTSEKPEPLALDIGDGEHVIVSPDELIVDAEGRRTFRLLRTAHADGRSRQQKMAAAALTLVVRQHFPDAAVEILHLADENAQPCTLSEAQLRGQHEQLLTHVRGIRSGEFPPNPAQRHCPGCPALFVCGELPEGDLEKKFA